MSDNNLEEIKQEIKLCRIKKNEYYKKWRKYEKLIWKLEKDLENTCEKHKWVLLKNYDYHNTTFECEYCGKIR